LISVKKPVIVIPNVKVTLVTANLIVKLQQHQLVLPHMVVLNSKSVMLPLTEFLMKAIHVVPGIMDVISNNQVEARREKNARQSNFNAVKNLPRIQTGGNVFQNDGNVIIIGTVKMERTKSIVLRLNAMPVNGHAVRTNLITLIVSQAIIGVIKKSIVMTSQMNKIATIVRAKRTITSAVVAFV